MKLTLVIGAATPPGRLATAVAVLRSEFERFDGVSVDTVDLHFTVLQACDGRSDEEYGAETREAIARIRSADGVVLTSPVYRASYPGVLKNLLDLLPVTALRDKPVGIVAIGGSHHHFLAVDWHLREVLSWFGAWTLPNAVYLTGKDFKEGKLSSDDARRDLEALAQSAVSVVERLGGMELGPAPLAARAWS